ncbi:uncharacterized protein [Nicotiana sylvestris]|uniref:uncharacterized protein n=1 Tax=Nicotiana sylvestris TaxID=4096 RepID=UPI00388C37A8
MAKTSKTVPQKEKASSFSSRPAGDKALALHDIILDRCVIKKDFKVENPPAFTRFRADLSQCEAELNKPSNEGKALKLLCIQKEEELKDLREDLAKARKNEGAKEKNSSQAKKITELEVKLAEVGVEVAEARSEVEKTKATADKTVVVYLRDAEAAQTEIRETSNWEKWSNVLAKCQSRRETLEEIHARGFDLIEEIAQARAFEVDARFLVSSSSDDDDEGSQGGFDNEEGPEEEAALEGETSPGHR